MEGFRIIKQDKSSKARLGLLKTAHGTVKTPAYVFVATYGKIRHLSPSDIKNTKTQLVISNTFHLWNEVKNSKSQATNKMQKSKILNPKPDTFLTNKLGFRLPTITDSGGFQVLSLAFNNKHKIGKFNGNNAKADKNYKRSNIKIAKNGVYFKWDGKWRFLGPELSIKIQQKIGADIIFAFDHITSPLDDYNYNKKAVEITDRWAKICLDKVNRQDLFKQVLPVKKQMLFGIIQGGLFRDLRIKSAKSIGSMSFDGFGIGGSYTKKQVAKILKWIIPHLPDEKPRHLLGIGKIDDIFEAVENGIDTFDCVIPTREARHGRIYTKKGFLDIRRGYFSKDGKPIESDCKCQTCKYKTSRSKIRELLKSPEIEKRALGRRYSLIHNMWFFNDTLEKIRNSIEKNNFQKFKYKFISKFSKDTDFFLRGAHREAQISL